MRSDSLMPPSCPPPCHTIFTGVCGCAARICSAVAFAWAIGKSESACPALRKVGAVISSVTLTGDEARMSCCEAGDTRP